MITYLLVFSAVPFSFGFKYFFFLLSAIFTLLISNYTYFIWLYSMNFLIVAICHYPLLTHWTVCLNKVFFTGDWERLVSSAEFLWWRACVEGVYQINSIWNLNFLYMRCSDTEICMLHNPTMTMKYTCSKGLQGCHLNLVKNLDTI